MYVDSMVKIWLEVTNRTRRGTRPVKLWVRDLFDFGGSDQSSSHPSVIHIAI